MTKNDLLTLATHLQPPSAAAQTEFAQKRQELAAKVNRSMHDRPDLEKLVGVDGRAMSEDNNRNFSLFMESLFQEFRQEVLVDTALWVFRAYRSHGFQVIYWPANLDTWMETLRQELSPPSFTEVAPFYRWLITNIPAFTELTEAQSSEPSVTLSHPPPGEK
jgi:hypothetical protein